MTETNESSTNNTMYYVLGAVVVAAIVAAGYFLMPKPPTGMQEPVANVPAGETAMETTQTPTPTPGPITGLVCDTQYYNPVIGFEKYYLSAEGGDLKAAKDVTCAFTVSQQDKIVARKKVNADLTYNVERGGNVFKCSTEGLELKPTIPTTVNVVLTDDLDASASCSAIFALPQP